MERQEKEDVVTRLAEQLRSTESLIVADYRGLTNSQLVELRSKLRENGARLQIVKNTLTRRAAAEAGTEALLALLEGPTAIAFIETDGDPIAVAKALADTAKDTKVLALRGGILSGTSIGGTEVGELAKLQGPDVVKAQLVGVLVAPLTQLAALLAAPVRDLAGLLDARIEQLGEGTSADAEVPLQSDQPAVEADAAEATGVALADEPLEGAGPEETVSEANDPATETIEAAPESAAAVDDPTE